MAGAWGARAAARQMAFFRVRTVEVRGVRYIQPNDVVSRLRIDTVASLWDDLEPYRQRVMRHPQVSDVRITRRMPGTLVVTSRTRFQRLAPLGALIPGAVDAASGTSTANVPIRATYRVENAATPGTLSARLFTP